MWLDPRNAEARTDLSLASLWSGLALANAGLGAVHGFASPIGGRFPAPHGAVCAALLAPVMAANLCALRARAGRSDALGRYAEVARWLTGRPDASADDGVAWVQALVSGLGIPRLSAYGVTAGDVPEIAGRARSVSSMKANPIVLELDELERALAAAL